MEKIMIIEDDPKIAAYLAGYISKYNYQVISIEQFDNIIATFQVHKPDLVLLDVNLPYYDGFYWCRQIRNISICPVIFISARTGAMDQVMAIENGGDDYITKPFSPDIVIAKIRSQLRRAYGEYAGKQQERVLQLENLKLYPERYELHFNHASVELTKNEAHILELLIERHPRVTGREDLLEKLWDDQAFVDENTLNVNMTRVRRKLRELGLDNVVETIRGSGYRLNVKWKGNQ
ncbi:response regulator transcription factor [Amphibacillus sp. MSJ-3]|uniref:response regulator transcription factor n=1 Tax=Amphibacillus sp. MSJ-3 TaxID=2841505 RepID=UPI00352FEEFF